MIQWFRAVVQELALIAHEIDVQLKRLNHGGNYQIAGTCSSRRARTKAFKAALTQQYQVHHRCC